MFSSKASSEKSNSYTHNACRLEAYLEKPRSKFTVNDLVEVYKHYGMRLVHLMHIGEDALLKSLDFVPRDISHLTKVLTGGERCDGSSIFPNSGIKAGASDIVLRPNPTTAFIDPFADPSLPSLCVICRHYGHDGKPLPQSPETIVERAYEALKKETGVELWAHSEIEYFLGRRESAMDIYGKDDKGYHAMFPFVFGQDVRRKAIAILAEIGVAVKYGHSECGYIPPSTNDSIIWEQHEVELALEPLPQAALSSSLTEWVLRVLAYKNDMLCSFKPMCKKGHAGSGMHVHMSPVRDGKHLEIRTRSGELSKEARSLIAGLTQVGGALMAFGNRVESSFVRLLQGKEAPNKVMWGDRNRHALIRLPLVAMSPDGEWVAPPTCEFRLGDGSAHPYYLMAGLGQAMLHGSTLSDSEASAIVEKTDCNKHGDNIEGAAAVPRNLPQVGQALREHIEKFAAQDVFPRGMLESWVDHYTHYVSSE